MRMTLALPRFGSGVSRLFNPRVDIAPLYTEAFPKQTRIPNVVYQTWKQTLIPGRHANGIAHFRDMNPDFSFRFFDDKAMHAYMREHYAGHPILPVYEGTSIMAAKADIWRYCVLAREGGVYCDIDSALSIPLRDLLVDNPSEMLSFERNTWAEQLEPGVYADENLYEEVPPPAAELLLDHPDHPIINWMLCFAPGHPILLEVIDLIVRNSPFFKNRTFPSVWKGVIHSTGPLALTQATWKHLARSGRRPAQAGFDYHGSGIFKLRGSDKSYADSPHYVGMQRMAISG